MVNVDKNDGLAHAEARSHAQQRAIARLGVCHRRSCFYSHAFSASLSLSFYVFYLLYFFHLSSNQPVAGDVDKERERKGKRGRRKYYDGRRKALYASANEKRRRNVLFKTSRVGIQTEANKRDSGARAV